MPRVSTKSFPEYLVEDRTTASASDGSCGVGRFLRRRCKPYSAFEVRNSSWIRQLDKMNSVHPQHRRGSYPDDYRHFILAFHDSTFECVAQRFNVALGSGPLAAVAAEAARGLG